MWYACGLFTLAGLAAMIATWEILSRLARLEMTWRWILAFFFVANGPLQYSLKEGNLSHYILFALVAGLALLRSDRQVAAGTLLGAVAIIKPPLLLFGAYFILRRDLRGSLSFLAVFCFATIASIAVFGWEENRNWFELSIVQYSHRWIAAFNNQSIAGFLFRLRAGPDLMLDWNPYLPPPGTEFTAKIIIGLLCTVVLISCIRSPNPALHGDSEKDGLRRDLQYMLVPCLTVVTSPLAWSHYYSWLLMPAAFFFGSHSKFPAKSIERYIGWSAIFLITPLIIPLLFPNDLMMQVYWRFGVSHLLFGGLLWVCLLAWWLSRSGGLVSAFCEVRQAGEGEKVECSDSRGA